MDQKVDAPRAGPRDGAVAAQRSLLVRLRPVMLLLLIAAIVGGGLYYWRYTERYPSTNSAYISANIVPIAAQVGGPLEKLYVTNNQFVRTGDPLFDIDTAAYDIAVKSAEAQFEQAALLAGKSGERVAKAAEALAERRRALDEARRHFDLVKRQVESGTAAQSELDEAAAALDRAQRDYGDAQDELTKAQEEIGKGSAQRTQLRVAAAALQKAELERAHTRVSAPVTGWVSGMDLRPGAMIAPGRALFSLVENQTWWVDANFKETDLTRIRPGQPATVRIDMYPGLVLEGRVESISAGSGAVFSLLPPENATGNWVKVTQRFTVRVSIPEPPADRDRPLRVGASATVTVDTVAASE